MVSRPSIAPTASLERSMQTFESGLETLANRVAELEVHNCCLLQASDRLLEPVVHRAKQFVCFRFHLLHHFLLAKIIPPAHAANRSPREDVFVDDTDGRA
jgi:hypothetical protein